MTTSILRNADLATRDINAHLHPFTNLDLHRTLGPKVFVGGEGITVRDSEGRRYIEGMAGLWCCALGFSDRRLARAGAEALERLPYYHSFYHRTHDGAIDLAERLLALMPVPMSKVFFANSGSEANDTAIKLIWYCNNLAGKSEKKKIISRKRGYHGVTLASASLTGLPSTHREFDLPLSFVHHVSCPHFYREGLPDESEEAFADRLAAELESTIFAEGPETVAAFIAEPVMGAGGVVVPPASYFAKVQAVLRRHDVRLIADEIICGFGRTGAMFGSEMFGLHPDIMTVAKALSAGYQPISAVIVNDDIYQHLLEGSRRTGTFGHGFTYSGHPVATAVALEALRIYTDENIVARVNEVAPQFQARLRALAERTWIGEARGIGLMGAVEWVADKTTRRAFDVKHTVGAICARAAEAEGLIVRPIGDSIAFSPPLIITPSEIDTLFDLFERALDAAEIEITTRRLDR